MVNILKFEISTLKEAILKLRGENMNLKMVNS